MGLKNPGTATCVGGNRPLQNYGSLQRGVDISVATGAWASLAPPTLSELDRALMPAYQL